MKPIVVDSEFKSIIPPLSDDEKMRLTESLVIDGCMHPLVVWETDDQWVLVDGHNRYEICTDRGIEYDIDVMHFATRAEALIWIIQNQLGRRNLAPFAKGELALKLKAIVSERARENQRRAREDKESVPESERVKTREVLAQLAGVSERTMDKISRISQSAPEEIAVKARTGELSIDRAYRIAGVLEGAPREVADVVIRFDVDEPETVEILKRLHKNGSETFEEVSASGFVQPGDEDSAVSIRESPRKIAEALREKSSYHAYEGAASELSLYWPECTVELIQDGILGIVIPERGSLPSDWMDGVYTVKITPRRKINHGTQQE